MQYTIIPIFLVCSVLMVRTSEGISAGPFQVTLTCVDGQVRPVSQGDKLDFMLFTSSV